MANSLYSLALEYNLGDKVKNEFIDKIKFVNYLLENLGHGWVMEDMVLPYKG